MILVVKHSLYAFFKNKDYTVCYYIGFLAHNNRHVEIRRTWKRQLKKGK